MPDREKSVLILGATGRVGQLLRASWRLSAPAGFRVVWQSRASCVATSEWLCFSPPEVPAAQRFDVVLSLLGVTRPPGLECNSDLALMALETAVNVRARHVFIPSSSAVYGPCPEGGFLSEDAPLRPVSEYGRAKCAMERAVTRWAHEARGEKPGVTILRIANIAGADALLGNVCARVTLDRFTQGCGRQGHGPERSYIGPQTLGRVFASLLARAGSAGVWNPLAPVLNIAAPKPVAMEDLLRASGRAWQWGGAPDDALARVALDVTRLGAVYRFDGTESDPEMIFAQLQAVIDADAAAR